jgi:hypothetical protein
MMRTASFPAENGRFSGFSPDAGLASPLLGNRISPLEVVTMNILLLASCVVGGISGILLVLSVGVAPRALR